MTTNERHIIAVAPADLENVEEARELYGIELPLAPLRPEMGSARVLLGHRDRVGSDDLRAGFVTEVTVNGVTHPATVTQTLLTDERWAFNAVFWSAAFIAAIEAGENPLLSVIEILSPEEFENLKPGPPEDL